MEKRGTTRVETLKWERSISQGSDGSSWASQSSCALKHPTGTVVPGFPALANSIWLRSFLHVNIMLAFLNFLNVLYRCIQTMSFLPLASKTIWSYLFSVCVCTCVCRWESAGDSDLKWQNSGHDNKSIHTHNTLWQRDWNPTCIKHCMSFVP